MGSPQGLPKSSSNSLIISDLFPKKECMIPAFVADVSRILPWSLQFVNLTNVKVKKREVRSNLDHLAPWSTCPEMLIFLLPKRMLL